MSFRLLLKVTISACRGFQILPVLTKQAKGGIFGIHIAILERVTLSGNFSLFFFFHFCITALYKFFHIIIESIKQFYQFTFSF